MTNTNILARRALIQQVIKSAGSTIFAVEFFKKDGTRRTMQIQLPAITKHLVGDAASASAKQAVATRKENHPELFAVFDIASQGIRSINLDTVVAVTLRGFRSEWSLPGTHEIEVRRAA